MTRALTDTGLRPDHAASITHAVQRAAEREQYVTFDQFRVGLAELRADIFKRLSEQSTEIARVRTELAEVRGEISKAEARIIKWLVGIVLTVAGIVTAAGVTIGLALLRTLGTLAGG